MKKKGYDDNHEDIKKLNSDLSKFTRIQDEANAAIGEAKELINSSKERV